MRNSLFATVATVHVTLLVFFTLPTVGVGQSGGVSTLKAMAAVPTPPPVEVFTALRVALPVGTTVTYNQSEFAGVTDDPATMQYLHSHRTLPVVGDVRVGTNGLQQLWIGGRLAFEAKAILDRRSLAQNGTIALAAVVESGQPAGADNSPDISKGPKVVEVIGDDNSKLQVTPATIDASLPLISPAGDKVAFSGSLLNGQEQFASSLLFVVDLRTGSFRVFGSKERLENYSVTAVEWVEDGKTLNVLEDYGETAGHMMMRQIHLE